MERQSARYGGLNVNPLVAKAIAMGDEFHQRNIAASLAFLKEVSPVITKMEMDEKDRYDVIKFLADTDQFFLNIMMATGKAVMDGARKITDGTVVTAMCRNGVDFGIRISGMGDEWFTAPVNTPQGLYFTGYDGEDACPDMGDSAITETLRRRRHGYDCGSCRNQIRRRRRIRRCPSYQHGDDRDYNRQESKLHHPELELPGNLPWNRCQAGGGKRYHAGYQYRNRA
ncbi:MAG: DUF1116 domain-containing protein [Enterocloster bolteae]